MVKPVWTFLLVSCLLLTACGTTQQKSAGADNQSTQTATASSTTTTTTKEDPVFFGKWKIDHVIAYSRSGSGLQDDRLKKMLGEKIVFSDKAFTSGDKSFPNPEYTTTEETNHEFWTQNRMNFQDFAYKGDKIIKVKVKNVTNKLGFVDASTVYVLDKNTLMINVEGVFIALTRE